MSNICQYCGRRNPKFYLEDRRPFTMIGNLKHKNSYLKGTKLDPFDKFERLNKSGQKVFLIIKDNRNIETNMVIIDYWDNLTASETRFIQRGLKELIQSNIICKIKEFKELQLNPSPHTYMINPFFIKCNSFNQAKIFWRFINNYEKGITQEWK